MVAALVCGQDGGALSAADGDASGIIKLPAARAAGANRAADAVVTGPDAQKESAGAVEFLDTIVVTVRDPEIAAAVEGDGLRIGKLAVARARGASRNTGSLAAAGRNGLKPCPAGVELLHAVVA